MKQRLLRRLMWILTLGTLLFAAVSRAESAPVRVACITPHYLNSAFWQEINDNIRLAADDLGIQLSMLHTKHSEPGMQLTLNEALSIAILSDVDAIIASYTLAGEGTNALLETAREKGVAVVMFDCDAPVDLRDAYVGIDNEAAGYEIGQTALGAPEEGETALFVYSTANFQNINLYNRALGIERAFAVAPEKLERLPLDNGLTLQTALEISKYIEERPQIGAVIAISETPTLTCAQLLDRIDPDKRILRCGFDESAETLALVQSGSIDLLISQPHGEMAYHSVEVALSLIQGETASAEEYLIDYVTLKSE